MTFNDYPDHEFLMMKAADTIASQLRSALTREERVTFAVPGGTTPGPIFDTLSGVDLDWGRIDVIPTDERWVPESSDRSNARLIRRRLITGRAEAATFHSLWREDATPEAALDEITEAIEPLLPPAVVLLGMGEDMHCASIFPDSDRRDEALADDAPPILPMRRPGEDEVRITLTVPVLRAAMAVHILITGEGKREALKRAEKSGPTEAPVAAILDEATVHWAE